MGEIDQYKDYILQLFLAKYWSANMIAEKLGVSRQGVILALQSWGVETSKAIAGWVWLSCSFCGREYKVPRSVARRKLEKKGDNFCGQDCYGGWLRKQFS